MRIKKYRYRIPFITLDRFLIMPQETQFTLFRKIRQSLHLQMVETPFSRPEGRFSMVMEFNFPGNPKSVLHSYTVTGLLVLMALFPGEEKTKKDLAYNPLKVNGMMNLSFRFGRGKPEEEEITIFIHSV